MEYTGRYKTMYSYIAGEEVGILEYKDNSTKPIPYCDCSRCGRPIKSRMWVVQSKETGVELFFLGSECIKRFS